MSVCSFELVQFRSFYGISYRGPDTDCKFFELLGSTGNSSYVASGYVYCADGHESFVVTGLESSRPKDAFYSALPDVSSVTDLGLILHGYSPSDPVIVDFYAYLEQMRQK